MLGLREEVHRDPVSRRLAVADHENFGGAGDHIDADAAEDIALRGRHIGVARADDLIDRIQGLRAIGECGNGLRAADREGAGDTREGRRREHELVTLAARGREHHLNSRNTRHVGRHRVHQHGGRISGLAARHVETD